MPAVVQLIESMRYDGTNSQEMAAWVGDAKVVQVDEDGTCIMSVTVYGLTYDVLVRPGWHTLRSNGIHYGSLSPETYAQQYRELPDS
ncbi:hypothetical protein [[Kitasatospora] papulosa]|uniref:hypothetical protein n=1 Tax=[Kitasatospora] papulosa TaxID=1464011 RepID=UPI0036CB1960